MNTKNLKKLVETIITLKAKLKCVICLDVIQELVELECSHKFCKECYLQHKSIQKQASCPLCKRILRRRATTYSDKYANSLGKFVYNCCENIKRVYKYEVEELKKLLDTGLEFPEDSSILKENFTSNNNYVSIPSTSKVTNQNIKQTKNEATKVSRKIVEALKENCENAFDKLLNNAHQTFNRKGAKRVYVNKKKLKKEAEVKYNILEFDNDENKIAVLQWLHDTRNKFDRLSQTQYINNEVPSEISVTDLVSISQEKEVCDKIIPFSSNIRKGRAKSLDIKIKNIKPTQIKRRSHGGSVNLENYNIEDTDTEEEVVKKAEEKVILDLIEDELLDTLENELQSAEDSEFDLKSKRTRPKKKIKQLSLTSTTTGWERLTKMEKTFMKKEKTPKQLNITLQSTQEPKTENKPAIKLINTGVQARETTNIDRQISEPNRGITRNEETNIENKSRPPEENNTEVLQKSTVDVSKKILKIALPRSNFPEGNKNILQNQKNDLDHDLRNEKTNENIKRLGVCFDNISEQKTTNLPEATRNERLSYDLDKLESYIAENMKIIDKTSSADNSFHDSPHEKDTNIPNLKKAVERQQRNFTNLAEKAPESVESSCVLLDVIFNTPANKTSDKIDVQPKEDDEYIVISDEITTIPENVIEQSKPTDKKRGASLNGIAEIYDRATQEIDHTTRKDTCPAREKYNSVEDFLHLFEACLENCITNLKSSDAIIGKQLKNLKFYLIKLKSLHKIDNEIVKGKVALCDVETQVVIDTANKSIQIENNRSTIAVQTEDLHCIKCNIDLNETKFLDGARLVSQDTNMALQLMTDDTKMEPNISNNKVNKKNTPPLKQISQNEVLTCSFDNLNFETQEVKKNQGTVTKVRAEQTQNKICGTNNLNLGQQEITKNQGNIPKIQPEQIEDKICSLDNLNFDTQEITKNQSTITKIQPEQIEDKICSLDNLNFETQEITENQGTITKIQPEQIPSRICSLENLNFETQEVAKNRGTITKIQPEQILNKITHSDEEKIDKKRNEAGENIPGSILVCSLKSDKSISPKKVNRKLTYGADKSGRFKRIRQPTSDSESDDEAPPKKKCNRFLRDDLTVEFLTNTERTDFKEPNKTLASDSPDSSSINYDEYLAEVMKKYDESSSFSNSPNFRKPNILTPKQETIKRCEDMIENANKNMNRIKTITELSTTSSKDSFLTASDNSFICPNLEEEDNVFTDENNLLKLENDIRAYEKGKSIVKQNSEISDIIGETEEVEPLPKKRKVTHEKNRQLKSIENVNTHKEKEDLVLSGKTCAASNDSFDEINTEHLLAMHEAEINLNKMNKIKIISDVKVKSQDKKENAKEEDDMFSDEDIVETTPQKKVTRLPERSNQSQLAASVKFINNVLPTPLTEADNFEFDIVALPPPLEFQDELSDIPCTPEIIMDDYKPVDDDPTPVNLNKSSLTPDHLSQFMRLCTNTSQVLSPCIMQFTKEDPTIVNTCNNPSIPKIDIGSEKIEENKLSLTPDKLSQGQGRSPRKVMAHSTPIIKVDLTRESLDYTPIPIRISQKMGITEMAQEAKYTPLKFTTKQTPQKQNMLTSTPGQKSIWNYIRPSQSTNDEASTAKTKPCIACTRLTKDQVNVIMQLRIKKLATFNTQYDSSVTHMIVMVNNQNCVKDYTIKFVAAVAAGIWVLRFEWIEECLAKKCIVPEEPFEVFDISGLPGPRTSRLTRKQNPLFRGYKFYCTELFNSAKREEVEEILKMLGGRVTRVLNVLLEDDGHIGLIIGEGHSTQDFDKYERWVEKYKTVTVDIEWLSKCVGQYKILSIRPFIWCSEDVLDCLGYPPILTETVPLSYTETF